MKQMFGQAAITQIRMSSAHSNLEFCILQAMYLNIRRRCAGVTADGIE